MNSFVIMSLALATGVTVWWFLVQRLQTKPWLDKGMADQAVRDMPPARVALRLFFGTMTSIFGISIVAYLMRMKHGGGDWLALDDPPVLWFNTALLVLASIAFQRARGAAKRGQVGALRVNLTAGGFLTIAFIAGQLWAWRDLTSAGHYVSSGPSAAFFYLLTAIHGLHLAGGLFVWSRTTARAWLLLGEEQEKAMPVVRLSVELCSVYWHYLLLVWLVLFSLLLAT